MRRLSSQMSRRRPLEVARRRARPLKTTACLAILMVMPPAAPAADKPLPARERRAELDRLLRHDCGACHGLERTGGLGPPLTPERLAGRPDDQLIQTILRGVPDTPMPPWKPLLSRRDARWLVHRLREGCADDGC